jgi:hypothetical protein
MLHVTSTVAFLDAQMSGRCERRLSSLRLWRSGGCGDNRWSHGFSMRRMLALCTTPEHV